MLPYVRDGESDPLSVPFRPATCGKHEIVIVANQGRATEARGSTTLTATPCTLYWPMIYRDGKGTGVMD